MSAADASGRHGQKDKVRFVDRFHTPDALRRAGCDAGVLAFALKYGEKPDGDTFGAGLGEVVQHGTAWLTPEDRVVAIAAYLLDGALRVGEQTRACGMHVMDNRPRCGMIATMIGLGAVISRLATLMLVLALFVGSLGLGTMSHASPLTGDAHAQHQMHDMTGMARDPQVGTGGIQTTDADCAMAVCCFSEVQEPRADVAGVAMSAHFVGVAANPAVQPAPDRADKPPRRT